MDTSILTSATNTVVTPVTGVKKVVRHVINWLEVYWWLPLSLLGIVAAAKFVYWLTGRPSVESPEWIVGFAFRVVCCVLAIILTSIYKQQVGLWLSREEQKLHIPLAIASKVETIAVVLAFLYVLMR